MAWPGYEWRSVVNVVCKNKIKKLFRAVRSTHPPIFLLGIFLCLIVCVPPLSSLSVSRVRCAVCFYCVRGGVGVREGWR